MFPTDKNQTFELTFADGIGAAAKTGTSALSHWQLG
jgi:hypothetical protein